MTALRLLGVIALAVVVTAGALRYRERARITRFDAITAAQRELASTPLAPAGVAPKAGISARAPIDVRAVTDRLAKQLHGDADFHHLTHRCGVCHATPDPALHTAAGWDSVLVKMSFNIDAAGLLPLSDRERAAISRLLRRYQQGTSAR